MTHNAFWRRGYESLVLNDVSDFVAAIEGGEAGSVRCAMFEARMTGRLHLVFRALSAIPLPSTASRIAFRAFLTEQGLHIRDALRDDGLMLEVLRNWLPFHRGSDVVLYRGETGHNHVRRSYGVFWTSDREIASMFGRGVNRCRFSGGVLLTAVVSAGAILTDFTADSDYMGESEYIVDPSHLSISVLETYSPILSL
ncbi:hypothetical protein AB7828_03795 [Tardiphaga sp. 215_C5_N2_1]|uniref:hypothetical protein n=1 Tax=Tardiphaga sp. 215_C5_N2_1 TaxID=3240774 RepID=UPI003F8B5040